MRFDSFLLWPVLAGLAACSPSQDWRDVALEVPGLKAQLPCKPDRTTREVPLGQRMVPLQVAGCESGSAMLTLTTARLQAGDDVAAILQGWQQASAARLQTTPAGQPAQAWVPRGMLNVPGAQRVRWQGRDAKGQPVQFDGVWGAWLADGQLHLVHAAVYQPPVKRPTQADASLIDTFFESLRP